MNDTSTPLDRPGIWGVFPRSSLAFHDRSGLFVACLLAAQALLILGVTTPVLVVTTGWWVFSLEMSYSVLDSVGKLWDSGESLMAGLIFAFSVILPTVKNVCITLLYFGGYKRTGTRDRVAALIGAVAKYSMVDVFVVALMIVVVGSERLAIANSGIGVACFVASLAISALALAHVKAGLKRAPQPVVAEHVTRLIER